MNNRNLHFFCCSLIDNIETLKISIPLINKYYSSPLYTIICPESSITTFITAFNNYKNVKIISEDSLISKNDFQLLYKSIAKEMDVNEIKLNKTYWYYQQVLKIVFALDNSKLDENIIMWDADTIPLRKLDFFDNSESILYGSLNEFHKQYFETLELIFESMPINFLAFTIQFFTCTFEEKDFLEEKLNKYLKKENHTNTSVWISFIVLRTVVQKHKTVEGSLISEQELFGLSNYLRSSRSQKKLIYIRFGLTGYLSNSQMKLLKALNFAHLSYESPDLQKLKKQNWGSLLILILKEYYFSIKYLLFIKLKKNYLNSI